MVTALAPLHLRAIRCQDFLTIVTGYLPAAAEADATVIRQLDADRGVCVIVNAP